MIVMLAVDEVLVCEAGRKELERSWRRGDQCGFREEGCAV
jgi:hypothetical protein